MGVVAKQASRASIAVGIGIVLGAVNTIFVLPSAFEGQEAQWGLIRILTAWGTILGQLSSFGMPSAILRFLPRFSPEEREGLLGMMLIIPLVLLSSIGAILWGWGDVLLQRLDADNTGLLSTHIGVFFSITVLIAGLQFCRAMLNFLLKSAVASAVEEVWLKGSYLLLALALLNGWLDFELFIPLYVVTYLTGFLVLASQIHWNHIRIRWRPMWTQARGIFDYGTFSLLSMSAVIIATNLDFVMVGYFLGLSAVPLYTMGFFMGSVVSMPVRSTSMIFNGLTADKIAKSSPSSLGPLLKQSARTQLLMSVAVMAGIWAGFQPFEHILPPAYQDLEFVFMAIGLQRIILASTGVLSNILGLSQHYRLMLPVNLGLLIITVISNYLFMKVFGWGLVGAALATMGTALWNNSWRAIIAWRKFRIHPFSKAWVAIVAIGLFCAQIFHWKAGWMGNAYVEAIVQGTLATGSIIGSAVLLGLVPEVAKVLEEKISWWPRRKKP
ncbi:MAG: lipopolysaccharide biosynthesis protein [Flavobacteriales bacterium]